MAAVDTVSQGVSITLTPQQITALSEHTNRALLEIVRDNLHTQYASKVIPLAAFRDAVYAHGGIEVGDPALLTAFRSHVPLSTYDAYAPFVDKFNARPCKEDDVRDLLSPGLPEFFAVSSATSGTTPKILPKYNHFARRNLPLPRFFDPNSKIPFAGLLCTRNREIKEVERASGEVVHRIPVCIATGAMLRRALGWYIDDESYMSRSLPGYAVPWAATMIGHLPSFLVIHGLFFLACRNLEVFAVPFATMFIDFVRYIDQKWDVLVSCIRDGAIPDLEGINNVRAYLQVHFHPDPIRAAELLDIGPPFSCDGWVARVWPNAHVMLTVCSGTFATVLPKVRSILGPNVALRSVGYLSSEAAVGLAHKEKLDEFVLKTNDVVEFLEVCEDDTHEHLCQPWEVEVGKQYEPILTTKDGLWRYRLGDVVSIVGFDAESGATVFKYSGRRSLAMHLGHVQITDDQFLATIEALNTDPEDRVVLRILEFTTVIDDRTIPATVGFVVEVASPLGPNAHLAPRRLFDALVATNVEHQRALAHGQMRLPTIRIVEAGAFAEYRRWRGERLEVASGQIKVPVVVVQPEVQAWFLEKVVKEL